MHSQLCPGGEVTGEGAHLASGPEGQIAFQVTVASCAIDKPEHPNSALISLQGLEQY